MEKEHSILAELATLRAENKTLFKRLEKQENTVNNIHSLATSVAVLAENLKDQNEDIKGIKKDMGELKRESANKDKEFKKKVVMVIVTAIVTSLINLVITI